MGQRFEVRLQSLVGEILFEWENVTHIFALFSSSAAYPEFGRQLNITGRQILYHCDWPGAIYAKGGGQVSRPVVVQLLYDYNANTVDNILHIILYFFYYIQLLLFLSSRIFIDILHGYSNGCPRAISDPPMGVKWPAKIPKQ